MFILQRGETAVDRAQSDDIREFIATAVDIHKELNRVKQPVIRPAVQLRTPEEPFKPKCDASFKVKHYTSFLHQLDHIQTLPWQDVLKNC